MNHTEVTENNISDCGCSISSVTVSNKQSKQTALTIHLKEIIHTKYSTVDFNRLLGPVLCGPS